MSRSRGSARAAGTRFERLVADYFKKHLYDRIDRRVRYGKADRGDIGGLRHMGGEVVVECKDSARLELSWWIREAEIERGNADALCGLVVFKRHGKANPADQPVLLTLGELVALLTGSRDHLEEPVEAAS